MIQKIKLMALGLVFSYNAIACGPGKTTNNYYGITPTGKNNSFSCADAGQAETLCLSTIGDSSKYTDGHWAGCITKACETNHFGQSCIDCILKSGCVNQPKDSDLPETPWEQCAAQGKCPENYKQELVYDACDK